MPDPAIPLISFETEALAPVLRYDIPEPTTYDGKNFIELDFGEDIFTEAALAMPFKAKTQALRTASHDEVRADVERTLITGASRAGVRAAVPLSSVAVANVSSSGAVSDSAAGPGVVLRPANPIEPSHALNKLIGELADEVLDGGSVAVGTNVSGEPTVTVTQVPEDPDPHLYLVETLRLTSYLGDYGAGRIVKTFTLLPGETTKISIKTYRQVESTKKSGSSVLDSLTTESATNLEKSVLSEQSDQEKYQKTQEYYADGEASARWGWGSASVKAGVKGSTNSAREESVKNVSNATQKHAATASAKRDVQINTSHDITEKEGEETSTERQIENINRSRTLNFVFRQMNQEFVTLLHLTDVRVGFFNGDRGSRLEAPIGSMDSVIHRFVKPALQDTVRNEILNQLASVRDRDGNMINVIRTVEVIPGDQYLQFDPELQATFVDARGRTHEVPGVLLKADAIVMRTEGVMVESLLGNGPALDDYAAELQLLEVERRRAEVDKVKAAAVQLALVNEIILQGDEAKAGLAEKLLRPVQNEPTGGSPPKPGEV